ncbi:MAG: GFA family protein [Rhizobiaceae bacterium]
MKLTGGCACGACRYEVDGEPTGMAACHCQACQKRTGSAFGFGCFFAEKDVTISAGEDNFTVYDRIAESGRLVSHRFCGTCGTTVMWKPERLPDGIAIAAGTFDDTGWIKPSAFFWVSKAQNWFAFSDDVPCFDKGQRDAPRENPIRPTSR